jgi:CubicO group peptidase (beta-lactamase class C family)
MQSAGIRRGLWFFSAIAVVALLGMGLVYVRHTRPISVATGTIAQTLCTEVFVSHLTAEDVYRETLATALGSGLIANHVHWSVDHQRQTVTADWFGRFASTAVYRGAAGCLLWRDHPPAPPAPVLAPFVAPWQPAIAGPQIVEPSDPALIRALDNIFVNPDRHIKAIVVVKNGQLVAERYAPGVGIDTPLLGYSVSKLVINALAGILVGQGRLHLDIPAPIAAWASGDDTRHAITLDNMLRMTSGLAIPESDSGLDAVSRMLFTEPDMAGFAAQSPVEHKAGEVYLYSSGNTLLVGRIIADAVGGTEADVLNFARTALFGPLGMHSAVIETDAFGTPVGSTFILASARDWACLGLLYLNDGVVAGHRMLPGGWVGYTRRPTLGTDYGAGVFTNAGANGPAKGRSVPVCLRMRSTPRVGSGNAFTFCHRNSLSLHGLA